MANKPKNNYKPGNQDIMLTPPHALEPLYPLIPKDWIIWESAANENIDGTYDSLIAKSLRASGYRVWASGLPDFDYFKWSPINAVWQFQVTNPPFSLKYKWAARAFELGSPFALLVPYETPFAAEFQKLKRQYEHNPYKIQVLSPQRRINFKTPNFGWGKRVWSEVKQKFVTKGNSAQMPTIWLTWGLREAREVYGEPFETFYVPMRNVKYNEQDEEIA